MNIPRHLVLFPDGNGRWAKQNKLPAVIGYKKGYENLVNFCYWCEDRGVKVLTVFGFTTETWTRPKKLVNYLIAVLQKKLLSNIEKYIKSPKWQEMGVRVRIIGQRDKISKPLQKIFGKIEKMTENNSKLYLNLAISYGGKWDILQAVKRITQDKIPLEKINEKLFESYLSTAGLPDPDLIIRAGGNRRLSNFALWQSAYSELYFFDKMWPDFTEKDLDVILADFSKTIRHLQ